MKKNNYFIALGFFLVLGLFLLPYKTDAKQQDYSDWPLIGNFCVVKNGGEEMMGIDSKDQAINQEKYWERKGHDVKIYRQPMDLKGPKEACDDVDLSKKDSSKKKVEITTNNNNKKGQSCRLRAISHKDTTTVWLQTRKCTKRAFKNSKMFFTYFNSWNEVVSLDKNELENIQNDEAGFVPLGPKAKEKGLTKGGALVKIPSDPRVYLLLGDKKYWITKEKVFNELNYKWSWIQDVAPQLLEKYKSAGEIDFTDHHPVNSLIKYPDSNKVYKLERGSDKDIVKRHIADEKVFKKLGYRFDRVVTISKDEAYPTGAKISIEKKNSASDSSFDSKKSSSDNEGNISLGEGAESPEELFNITKDAYESKNWNKIVKGYTNEEVVKQIATDYNAIRFALGFASSEDMIEMIKNKKDLTAEEEDKIDQKIEETKQLEKRWNKLVGEHGLDKFSNESIEMGSDKITNHVKNLSDKGKAELFGELKVISNDLSNINDSENSRFHNMFTGSFDDKREMEENKVRITIQDKNDPLEDYLKTAININGNWYWYVPRMEQQDDGSYSL